MPLFKSWKIGEGVFAIWKVEESNGQLRALLKGAFPYDADISRMKAESRRSEYLAVRVLLAEVCGEEKEICHEPSGKPFLADGSFHLSISHTKGYVAVALHPTREVGIDIEQVSGMVLKVADRFMSVEELQGEKKALETYSGGAERSTLYYMLLHWSAKETMFKLMNHESSGSRFQEPPSHLAFPALFGRMLYRMRVPYFASGKLSGSLHASSGKLSGSLHASS